MISESICERRSRVSGSMTWYSSSIPKVKLGFMACRLSSCCFGAAQKTAPVEIRLWLLVAQCFVDCQLRDTFDHPLKISFADRMNVGVGRGIQEIDRIWHTVLDRKFDCVEIVAERAAERQAIADNAFVQCNRAGLPVLDVPQMVRQLR